MLDILHTESSLGWGGQEIRILLEVEGLRKRGFHVGILARPQSHLAKRAQDSGIPTYLVEMRHSLDVKAVGALFQLLKETTPKVLNTHSSVDSWLGSMAGRLAKVPALVRTRHLSVPISKNPLNIIYRMPDAIITTGESIRKTMIRENGIDAGKVFSIPTGVSLDRFDPEIPGTPVRKELGISRATKVVTIVAVLRSWKRHDVFLEAAGMIRDRMPSTVFLIVGTGPVRKRIQEAISVSGLNQGVVMMGHREDVNEILAASDVCVLTSDGAEGVPQAVLQYMAMGKSVVATDVGSVSEVVTHGKTGLLVVPNDVQAVAEAVLSLLQDPDLANSLGKRGRERVERRFSLDVMLDNVQTVYSSILEQKGKSTEW